jgi:aerobic carbon-monoxide dehydrogenase small subunit
MAEKILVRCTVNGQAREVRVWPMARLLDVLRNELGFTGVKEGCGEGECGACAVLIDGELANSCLVPMTQVEGAAITTIEGLAESGRLHPVQEALIAHGGVQCGMCTPGMAMAAAYLTNNNARPTESEARRAIAGNLCRCTGYARIVEAVRKS